MQRGTKQRVQDGWAVTTTRLRSRVRLPGADKRLYSSVCTTQGAGSMLGQRLQTLAQHWASALSLLDCMFLQTRSLSSSCYFLFYQVFHPTGSTWQHLTKLTLYVLSYWKVLLFIKINEIQTHPMIELWCIRWIDLKRKWLILVICTEIKLVLIHSWVWILLSPSNIVVLFTLLRIFRIQINSFLHSHWCWQKSNRLIFRLTMNRLK